MCGYKQLFIKERRGFIYVGMNSAVALHFFRCVLSIHNVNVEVKITQSLERHTPGLNSFTAFIFFVLFSSRHYVSRFVH